MSEPQISIVAVGRNDDYGGDFRSRLQSFIKWTHAQLVRAEISAEIIFVNYNPIEGESIQEFIEWPESNKWVNVRIITVPAQTHAEIVEEYNVKNVPVLEYVAKNIGIRRSKGKYVLCMNPDILISEAVFSKLKTLSETHYFRANRLDYSKEQEIDCTKPLYEQLKKAVSAIWFKGSCRTVKNFTYTKYYFQWFLNSWSNLWKRNTKHLEWILNICSIPVYYDNMQYKYHSNASGDFMLMSKENWFNVNGYKESSYISLHVDSLMVLQAAFSGLTEKVFTYPIYHKQHKRRYDAANLENEDQQKVYKRYQEDIGIMKRDGKPIIYNDVNWGRVNSSFVEFCP